MTNINDKIESIRTGENLENSQTIIKKLPKIQIGKLPIMLKSSLCVLKQYSHIESETLGECNFDAGGYFIINGSDNATPSIISMA